MANWWQSILSNFSIPYVPVVMVLCCLCQDRGVKWHASTCISWSHSAAEHIDQHTAQIIWIDCMECMAAACMYQKDKVEIALWTVESKMAQTWSLIIRREDDCGVSWRHHLWNYNYLNVKISSDDPEWKEWMVWFMCLHRCLGLWIGPFSWIYYPMTTHIHFISKVDCMGIPSKSIVERFMWLGLWSQLVLWSITRKSPSHSSAIVINSSLASTSKVRSVLETSWRRWCCVRHLNELVPLLFLSLSRTFSL